MIPVGLVNIVHIPSVRSTAHINEDFVNSLSKYKYKFEGTIC